MRRYLKPVLTVAAAGAAAVIVMTSGSSFGTAPVAKTKTIECRESEPQPQPITKKVKKSTIPVLPSIPKAQLPCDKLTQTPPGLETLPGKLAEVQARVQNALTPTTSPGPCAADNPAGCLTEVECEAFIPVLYWDGDSCEYD